MKDFSFLIFKWNDSSTMNPFFFKQKAEFTLKTTNYTNYTNLISIKSIRENPRNEWAKAF